MSDLISREEVLNLIDTAFENGAFDGRYAYENLVDAVQNLIHPLETDLVSRQAVIDTIETDCSWDMFNEWGSRTPIGESIIEAIKRVPSVESEKCGDCISREAAIQAVTHFDNSLKRLYELPAVNPAKWIPCKERMPKAYEEVIVYRRKNKGIYLMYHTRYGYWESNDGEGFSFDDSEIVAWMPEPEPYDGEVDE